MKLLGDPTVGELGGGGGEDCSGGATVEGGETVVVGVNLDPQSRELLTWALVKVAQSGDRVIALHVLNPATERQSSLLSLVKTFDSMLAVYEGFCNLKQVDLKLKVCRGTSVRKILVQEAKTYARATVIVGSSRTLHTIRSSASVAKYCGRKLSKNFSVLAVNNGKVVYQREATTATGNNSRDNDWHKNYVHSIHQSLSKNLNLKLLNDTTAAVAVVKSNTGNRYSLRKSASCSRRDTLAKDCSTCAPNSVLPDNSGTQTVEVPPSDGSEDSSLALVPIQTPETVVSSSNSIVIRKSPELRTGWPLLRRVFLCNKKPWEKSNVRKMPVVQWILRFPGRYSSAVVHPDQKQISSGQDEDQLFNLDGETGAIVPVGTDGAVPPPSPYNCLKSLPKELVGFHEKYSSTCRLFSYQELLLATSNFITENLVGKGGSSQVYRGCLPDCKELAVKILKPSEDVLKEFVSEVEIITTLHHKNIISLFGLCFEDNNLVLVYDFLPRGSLEENLHGNKKDEIKFGWGDRYKVALGVAEALDYLHNCSPQPVIHRDVKSSNILLSDDFEPQLSDFGLATWAATSSSHMACTDVAGTFGYLAPEYFMYGKVNDKIDVYAFGVVLLELLSGRKPINSEHPKGQESLVMWAKPILKGGKVFQLLDPRLGSNYDHDQIERMGLAATLCIRRAHRFRPEISLVLKLLQGDMETIKWARQQVNALEELDAMDGEAFPSDIQSHLNLALLDLEDDSLSVSSSEQSVSLEDYLQGRWSRTSSFN